MEVGYNVVTLSGNWTLLRGEAAGEDCEPFSNVFYCSPYEFDH